MTLRVFSASIHPRAGAALRGAARFNLADGSVDPADPVDVLDRRMIGSGPFLEPPCVVLALRRFTVSVSDVGSGTLNDVDFNLDHSFEPAGAALPTHLLVEWAITHRIQDGTSIYLRQEGIREISLLLIGSC
ncbi:MAG: hypothetical protein VKO00_03550 [Cyanobacteriota bacterium]|jgi:hypothetical protein|nr:hypothetical protein [Cyanobacteriota bacterium]